MTQPGTDHELGSHAQVESHELNQRCEGAAVIVVEYNRFSGGSATPSEQHEFSDPHSFAEFLDASENDHSTLCRLIHARNAPWAIPLIEKHNQANYSSLADWMAAPAVAFSPREQVWPLRADTNSVHLMFGYEYFVTHSDDGKRCSRSRFVDELRFNHYVTGHPTTWRVCLQRLGFVCFSTARNHKSLRQSHPAATFVIFEDTQNCPASCHVPLNIVRPEDESLDAPSFSHLFFEHVLYWAVRQVTDEWSKLIRGSQAHVLLFEQKIFTHPENEYWGETLWQWTRNWNAYNRLVTLHLRSFNFLQRKAEWFLKSHYNSWEAQIGGLEWDKFNETRQGQKLFGSFDKVLNGNQTELIQGLINPTTNMLDMIYKRVAIRDARHSLMLNQSLWRLSWVTFIFLPLTFVAGIFGMNVDLFANNPSIKWWFIVAIPLMILVLLGWFLFRGSYAALNRASLRRGKKELNIV